jgi:hypothetical protein
MYSTVQTAWPAVAEIIAVVDVFNGTNSLANAYQVEPDVAPDPD